MFFLSHKTISKCLKILEEECFAKLYTTFFYFRKVEQILNLNINIKAIVLSEVHYYYFTSPVHHTLAGCSFRNGVLYMYIYMCLVCFLKSLGPLYITLSINPPHYLPTKEELVNYVLLSCYMTIRLLPDA